MPDITGLTLHQPQNKIPRLFPGLVKEMIKKKSLVTNPSARPSVMKSPTFPDPAVTKRNNSN